jgi:hypothetical protein
MMMSCRSSPLYAYPIALLVLATGCDSGEDSSVPPSAGSSGGAFVGSGGKAGGFSSGGSSIGGAGGTSPCSLSGGPVDVGRIGGPGRDATSNRWTRPFTARMPRLALDPSGNAILSMQFALLTVGEDSYGAVDSDDTAIAKFDADGAPLWSKHLAPSGDTYWGPSQVNALATDAQGNIFLAGSFSGVTSFGGPDLVAEVGPSVSPEGPFRDAFLVKLDPDGEHLWSLQFGDANDQQALALAVDGAGNPTVAGNFGGIVDFGGESFTSRRGSFGYDGFVARFDGDGNHVGSGVFGEDLDEHVAGIAVDAAGNTVVYGEVGAIDELGARFSDGLLVQKRDPSFSVVYTRTYPANSGTAAGLALDPEQNAVLTGVTPYGIEIAGELAPAGMFALKLDGEGNPLWQRSFGDGVGAASAAAVDDQGNIVVSGAFAQLDLGGGALISAGSLDVFVAKLATDGSHLWSQRGGSCGDDQGLAVRIATDGSIYVAGSFVDAIDFGSAPVRGGRDFAAFLARFDP